MLGNYIYYVHNFQIVKCHPVILINLKKIGAKFDYHSQILINQKTHNLAGYYLGLNLLHKLIKYNIFISRILHWT